MPAQPGAPPPQRTPGEDPPAYEIPENVVRWGTLAKNVAKVAILPNPGDFAEESYPIADIDSLDCMDLLMRSMSCRMPHYASRFLWRGDEIDCKFRRFTACWKARQGDDEAKAQLTEVLRPRVSLENHPWPFRQNYIQQLRAEGRLAERT
eukprot:TRINITY_DN80423_c0_g1_i1.p1 TRINITY_DN80423_c0_g1~~TRINITY_DN80423_c0_g1_i1.p1  ORF type:complete len:150 (-),score=16.02 TRINITY_DN80423_c0_g1_i1:23-472(-)